MGDEVRTADGGGPRPVVVGLAGGIGSGKTALAQAFARMGFEVVDADGLAKGLLDTPEVRATLVEWWGDRVVSDTGAVDRGEVARIVFDDDDERRRLEGLVHPLVVERTREVIERAGGVGGTGGAGGAGRIGVVVDAPLLFEAGLDGTCDAVVFVHADEAVRRKRVVRQRGWSDSELDRRERAQMGLDEKRRRSRFVVDNNSEDLSALEGEAGRIYDILRLEAESRPD